MFVSYPNKVLTERMLLERVSGAAENLEFGEELSPTRARAAKRAVRFLDRRLNAIELRHLDVDARQEQLRTAEFWRMGFEVHFGTLHERPTGECRDETFQLHRGSRDRSVPAKMSGTQWRAPQVPRGNERPCFRTR